MSPIARALISVSDKTGLLDLARPLAAHGVEILSTGGTCALLTKHDIPVIEVADYTGFPEMMGGRLKTLHPRIHGGILGRRGIDDWVMRENDIRPIDLVVVNLYPFAQTVAAPDCTFAEAIEQIDIGGPTLLRAAAKNCAAVTVIVDPADYPRLLSALTAGTIDEQFRRELAAKAFAHTADYDARIAAYLSAQLVAQLAEPADAPGGESEEARLPDQLSLQFTRRQILRYGENPHQQAAFYVAAEAALASVASARQLQGKELSFNNIADTDAALECVKQFAEPACVIVKHANPCGVAEGETLFAAYTSAFRTDPESAFGGIIAVNRALDAQTAAAMIERQFIEVIVAPSVTDEAAARLAERKNLRLLVCGDWPATPAARLDLRTVHGGLLAQTTDLALLDDLRLVTRRAPTAEEERALLFAWRVAKFVKSNAIVYARDGMTLGVGAGQMSRVNSARIAAIKAEAAGFDLAGAAMASDAFFPFRDGIDQAAAAGIAAVIQPGGSLRDAEVIAAADEHGIAMLFTGMRHFRH